MLRERKAKSQQPTLITCRKDIDNIILATPLEIREIVQRIDMPYLQLKEQWWMDKIDGTNII